MVAGSDYFAALLADSEQHCTINLDMTDLQFDAIKLFMYSNVAQFDNRPYSYSQEFLPKLVKVRYLVLRGSAPQPFNIVKNIIYI
jgi:hypothetical protein